MDQSLLEVVVCPVTRSKLRLEGEFLVAERGGMKYPIKDGIPVLIAEQGVLPEGVKSLEELKGKLGK